MLVIHDEQVVKRLQDIAARENHSVEDILWSMVNHYCAEKARQSGKIQTPSKTFRQA